MMGLTDGAYCAQRSEGCAMVQLGAYLAEPTATAADIGPHDSSFLPADSAAWTAFLAAQCRAARGSGDVLVCLNLAAPRLDWALEAGACFAQAGGDLLELNVHGGYRRYYDRGLLRAMVRPENQPELCRWVEALVALDIPLIVKFHGQSERSSLLRAIDHIVERGVPGLHVNVRRADARAPDVDLVCTLRGRYSGLLLVSGYVRSADDAHALFEAGADMVGLADPTRRDPGYIAALAARTGRDANAAA
jgi:tRNA-dihydrouridine synthase